MYYKLKLVLLAIFLPLNLIAQTIESKTVDDATIQKLSQAIEKQNIINHQLDSTMTHLKNENTI